MKGKLQHIDEKYPEIKTAINKLLKNEFGLENVFVKQVSFGATLHCNADEKTVCKYYGKDSNGDPIVVCKCVKK